MAKPIRMSEEEFTELMNKSKPKPKKATKSLKEYGVKKVGEFKKGLSLIKEDVKEYPAKSYHNAGKWLNEKGPVLSKSVHKAPLTAVSTMQQGLSFVKGSPKDYVKQVTQHTATMSGTRGERSRNGLRSEFTSRGPVNKNKMPILDEHWSTHLVAPGNLSTPDVRSRGSLQTPGRVSPTLNEMAPRLSLNVDVIMPKVRKIGRK